MLFCIGLMGDDRKQVSVIKQMLLRRMSSEPYQLERIGTAVVVLWLLLSLCLTLPISPHIMYCNLENAV